MEFVSILYVQICRRFCWKKVCYLVAGSCCSSYQECGRNELRRHRESNQCSRRKGECVEILRFQRINKENTFMSTSDLGDDTQRLVSCVVWTRNFADSSLRKAAAALRHVAMVENFWISTNPWPCNGRKKRRKKKKTCMTFLCMIALRNNTAAHTFYHRWTMLMSVCPYKRDCYLGNVTSYVSSLLS